MSQPDFTNPSVRKNFFLSQMQEGKGEFVEKQSVLVFRDEAGGEYVVPEDTIHSLPEGTVVKKEKAKAPKKAVAVEPVEEETAEPTEEVAEPVEVEVEAAEEAPKPKATRKAKAK